MDMPRIETLEEAKHFLKGPAAYAGATSPWKEPIRSYQRAEAPLEVSQMQATGTTGKKV